MEKAYFYNTSIGTILISEDGEGITHLSMRIEKEDAGSHQAIEGYEIQETELLQEAATQLTQYLEGNRKKFDIKLKPNGTEFQRKVWEALREIPYGETRSYKQIACAVGNEKASRAVGMANHNNPILCMIPCHRVIGANGSLVGFGAGLEVKQKLLDLEK